MLLENIIAILIGLRSVDMKKTRKSDYIIMALFCLVALNIGSIMIERYSPMEESLSLGRKSLKVITSSTDYIKKSFSLSDMIDKVVVFAFPIKEVSNEDYGEDQLHERIEDLEIETGEDIIIEDLEEYESLIIIKDSIGMNTFENIPKPINVKKLEVDEDNPYILMYHTHATESFMPARENNWHVSDTRYNILGMGEILTTILEAGGHKVDHVHTYHDLPSYNKSYSKSLNTINNKIAESDNLKILLDIHRDGVEEDSPNVEAIRRKSKIEINGKSVATFRLVIGPDSENKEEVLNFAKYIMAVSDALYPGLCKGIVIKPYGKYNQHKSDYSSLIELGYNINNIEEATESAKLLGEILSLVIRGIKEQ